MAAEYDSQSLGISKILSCFFSCNALMKIYHNKGVFALYFWKKTVDFPKKIYENLWRKFFAKMHPYNLSMSSAPTNNVVFNQGLRQSHTKPITKNWCRGWGTNLFKFSKFAENFIKEWRYRISSVLRLILF